VIPEIDRHILNGIFQSYGLSWLAPSDFNSLPNLPHGVQIFSNHKCNLPGRCLDFIWEILGKHIVDLDYETKSNETLNDHCKLFSLADSQDEDNLCENWRQELHSAKKNIDESASFAIFGCLDILQISEHTQSLFHFTVDDHVKQQ